MYMQSDDRKIELYFGDMTQDEGIDLILDMKNAGALSQDLCDELLRVYSNPQSSYSLEEYEALVALIKKLQDAMLTYVATKRNKPETLREFLNGQ